MSEPSGHSSWQLHSLGDSFWLQSFFSLLLVTLAIYFVFYPSQLCEGFPTAGIRNEDGFNKIERARQRWMEQGSAIIDEGLKKFSGCFQVVTAAGPKIILRGKYADEIRNDPHLIFQKAISTEFFGTYSGFDAFADAGNTNKVIIETVRGRLTQSLNFITEDLARETSKTLDRLCGQPDDWTKIKYKPLLLQLSSCISTRVFVGPELCENQEWLDVSVSYVVQAFTTTAHVLHSWLFFLRPLVHYFLPESRELRRILARAKSILEPVIANRRAENADKAADGERLSKVANAIGWMDEAAKGQSFDITSAQLSLSLAAIHTTSELMSGIITDICTHPEWLEPLRQDIATPIKEDGWTKKALQEMKLVDSFMKESQRHDFGDIASMVRYATEDVTLSDGVRIPKGAYTMVSIERMNDTTVFEDPTAFLPDRFMKLRKIPGQENKWHFVMTSPKHLAFGHGKHSCPGRFFAANETKVVLAYLLMRFDWKHSEDGGPAEVYSGSGVEANPDAEVLIKRRSQDVLL